jgi:hypothetical protein
MSESYKILTYQFINQYYFYKFRIVRMEETWRQAYMRLFPIEYKSVKQITAFWQMTVIIQNTPAGDVSRVRNPIK